MAGEREDAGAATFAAGFEFARRLRDPDFRSMLQRLGHSSGQHVIIAVDEEPVVDVITRLMFHETGGRALIAIAGGDDEPWGFHFLFAEVVKAGADHPEPVALGAGASIGMLYAMLEPCGAFVPSEWTALLLFEKVS